MIVLEMARNHHRCGYIERKCVGEMPSSGSVSLRLLGRFVLLWPPSNAAVCHAKSDKFLNKKHQVS